MTQASTPTPKPKTPHLTVREPAQRVPKVKPTPQAIPPSALAPAPPNAVQYSRIRLPSRGLPYRSAGFEGDEIEIRPLTLAEVIAVKRIQAGTEWWKLAPALAGVTRPLQAENMTLGDFIYVLAWLRLNTYRSAPFDLEWTCPVCGHANTFRIDLSKIELIELPLEFQEPFHLTLSTGREIALRLPRIGDSEVVRRYLRGMLRSDTWDEAAEWLPGLAICVANGSPLGANVDLLGTMTPDDIARIEAAIESMEHGFPALLESACSGTLHFEEDGKEGPCEFVHKRIRFDFRLCDLAPFSEYRGLVRNGVRFGDAPAPAARAS